jgi:spermidine synthase
MTIEGNCISSRHDEYGPVQVYQTKTCRILSFDGEVEQSCMNLHSPDDLVHQYTQAMMAGLIFIPEIRTATVMGLGAGSMVKCLLKSFDDLDVHVIEYRQEVINAARDFFYLPDDERLNVHLDDAVTYMKNNRVKSDIIFSDLYNSYGMEPRQIQLSFLRNCKKSLTQQGVLVLNLWHRDFRSTAEIEDLLSHEFENRLLSFQVEGGNTIVLAFKNNIPGFKRKNLLIKGKKLQEQMQTPVERYAKLLWSTQQFKFGID